MSQTQPCLTVRLVTLVYMSTLHERIELANEILKLSAPQLAEACNVSRVAAHKWLTGETKKLDVDVLFPLARALKVDAEWLATGRGHPRVGQAPATADEEFRKHLSDAMVAAKKVFEQTIADIDAQQTESYRQWEKRIEQFNHERDSGAPTPIKPRKKRDPKDAR